MNDRLTSKHIKNFVCKKCDFSCSKIGDYKRHLLTLKHKKITNNDGDVINNNKFICKCGKEYKHRQNLHTHKKKCKYIEEDEEEKDKNIIIKTETDELDYRAMFMKLITDNKELRDTLVTENKELRTQISELIPMVGNHTNSHNNIKQKFNINVFLNEQCKDALTMNEFIDKIKITIDNLMITKNKGIAEGVSNIFIENMNKLSLHERPIHCTDVKRETMYIKCGDSINGGYGPRWEKDQENKKIKQALEKISHVQNRGLKEWVEKHPSWENNPDEQEEYLMLINKCTSDLMIDKREEKIIKKLCNEVYIKSE